MANNFSPFVPQWWANGALAILNETLVSLPLVNNDFSDMFSKGGQIVNTRRPSKMSATRKAQTSAIAQQDVTATNVAIPLNQQIYTSFQVQDLDQQYAMEDLIEIYLQPAAFSLARQADRTVMGQAVQFLAAGYVSGSDTSRVYNNIVDGRTLMDNNLAYEDARHFIMSPSTEGKMLKDQILTQVNTAGTNRPLRNGEVGNLVGIDLFKTQTASEAVLNPNATGVVLFNVLAAVAPGATTFTYNQTTPAIAAGDWLRIGGQPYLVASVTGSSDPRTVTVTRPFAGPIATTDNLYAIKPVTLSTSYASGYQETIVVAPSGAQFSPMIGSYILLNGSYYAVIDSPASNTLLLDRPLDNAVTTGNPVQTLPPGSYSWMFHRNCMTVAIRPLAPTRAGAGVLSAVASANGLTVRSQMWYDATYQAMKVSLDFLMGVQILDLHLGAVICS